MAELSILYPDGRRQRVKLERRVTVLGRDPMCDIPLDDLSTSRRHAQIRPGEEHGYVLEDLGSKNGTLLNDVRATCQPLKEGDEILVGMVKVVFHGDAPSPAPPQIVISDDDTAQAEEVSFARRDRKLHLSQRRLEAVCHLSTRLARLREPRDLLEDVMDICFEHFGFERGAIAVYKPNQRGLEWPVVRNLRGADGELKVSRTILKRALEMGERAVISDAAKDIPDPTISMVQQGICSALCAPLLYEDDILGVIYGDRVSTMAVYTPEDADFLAALAGQVSIGLINARLMEAEKQRIALESEVALARRIQIGLFPAEWAPRSDIEVAAINEPGRHVSGDYYDVILLEDGKVVTIVADVTGEGVAASLLMANLQAAVRFSSLTESSLAQTVEKLNDLIYRNTDASRFITFALMLVDPAARTLHLVDAGHPDPFVVVAGEPVRTLTIRGGLPLGVLEEAAYEVHEVRLDRTPCTILLFTDGAYEAMNPAGALLGMERFADLVRESASLPLNQMLKKIARSLRDFSMPAPQGDDITLLGVRLP